jgi:hypothetical protein
MYKKISIKEALFAFCFICISTPTSSATDYWVNSDRIDRRTCPSDKCGLVGQLFFREKVTILEIKNGWGRISQPYFASCSNGRSEYVDSGNASCTAKNGIVDGKFAEWIKLKQLSKTRPADPGAGAGATGVAALVSSSDDYRLHKEAFVKATETLLAQKKCTEADFKEFGGWFKSVNDYRDQPVYLLYCGGVKRSNRIYLDASSGRIF